MKKFKLLALTLFLTIGFIIPSCDKDTGGSPDIPPCDDVGPLLLYFDVHTISVSNFSNLDRRTEVPTNDSISIDELITYIDYLVSYSASVQPKKEWSFSLFPTANACTYNPGDKGSKNEALVNLSIITLNDFDDDHLANTNINDLFDYWGGKFDYNDPIPLTQFLNEQTENLKEEDMVLKLTKAPEINQEFKIKVIMELSTEEVFEFETEPIFITP